MSKWRRPKGEGGRRTLACILHAEGHLRFQKFSITLSHTRSTILKTSSRVQRDLRRAQPPSLVLGHSEHLVAQAPPLLALQDEKRREHHTARFP